MAHYVEVYGGGQGPTAKFVRCKVVESLGFVHDLGFIAKVVMFEGEERVVVLRNGMWQRRTPRERVAPLLELPRSLLETYRRKGREEALNDPA